MIRDQGSIVAEYANAATNKIRTSIPAYVIRFDPELQVVDVEIAVKRPVKDGILNIPNTLLNVPLIYPAGTGWVIAAPLQPGDGVWLMYTAFDCTNYQLGEPNIVHDAEGRNFHGGETPFAIPGVTSLPFPRISQNPEYQEKVHIVSDIDVIMVTGEGNVETLCGPETVTVTIGGTQVLTVHSGGIHIEGDVTATGDVFAGDISLREHAHNSGVPNGEWCLLDGEFRWCYGHTDSARVHSSPFTAGTSTSERPPIEPEEDTPDD